MSKTQMTRTVRNIITRRQTLAAEGDGSVGAFMAFKASVQRDLAKVLNRQPTPDEVTVATHGMPVSVLETLRFAA